MPLFVLAALMLSGCLATTQEIEDLRVDIVRLQDRLSQFQTRQDSGQTNLQGNQADLMDQMATLTRRLEALNVHLEESQNQNRLLSSRVEDLDKNLSNRLDLMSEALTGTKSAVAPPPSSLYGLAYQDFTRRRYKVALKGFENYLKKYGDTGKAADAQFYIGECHFARKKWDQAVEAYDKVLTQYSTSTVVPSAYFQKGQSLENLGKASEAIAIYDAIARKYPHRPETQAARARLETLKKPPSTPSPPEKP